MSHRTENDYLAADMGYWEKDSLRIDETGTRVITVPHKKVTTFVQECTECHNLRDYEVDGWQELIGQETHG